MKKTALSLSMFLLAVLLMVPLASADTINLSLASPIQSGTAGETFSFTATATAVSDGLGPVYLLGTNFAFDNQSSTFIDDSPFFLFPIAMAGGDSFTDTLFTLTLPGDFDAGVYSGNFSILGGVDPGADPVTLATVDFTVNVAEPSAVPEPESLVLLGSGLGSLAMMVASRRRNGLNRAA